MLHWGSEDLLPQFALPAIFHCRGDFKYLSREVRSPLWMLSARRVFVLTITISPSNYHQFLIAAFHRRGAPLKTRSKLSQVKSNRLEQYEYLLEIAIFQWRSNLVANLLNVRGGRPAIFQFSFLVLVNF